MMKSSSVKLQEKFLITTRKDYIPVLGLKMLNFCVLIVYCLELTVFVPNLAAFYIFSLPI